MSPERDLPKVRELLGDQSQDSSPPNPVWPWKPSVTGLDNVAPEAVPIGTALSTWRHTFEPKGAGLIVAF